MDECTFSIKQQYTSKYAKQLLTFLVTAQNILLGKHANSKSPPCPNSQQKQTLENQVFCLRVFTEGSYNRIVRTYFPRRP